MSLRAAAITLRLRPPGATAWTTIVTTTAAAATRALAIGPVEIEWSRPTPRDHPDPATMAITLLVPPDSTDADLVTRDTEVSLTATLESLEQSGSYWAGIPTVTLGRGWIDSWTRTTRPDGRHAYRLHIIDALARAAATRLAATPWPAQTQGARIAAINAASPWPLLAVEGGLPGRVGPRDVDNANALDIIRATAYLGQLAVPSGPLIALHWPPTSNLTYYDNELQATPYMYLVTIPTRLLEDAGRRLDRTNALTQAAATYYPAPGATDTETASATAGGTGYSTSSWTVTTDTVPVVAAVAPWLAALITESNVSALPMLQPGRVILNAPVVVERLWYLLDQARRHWAILRIPDAPADLDELQAVTSGRLTIDGLRLKLSITCLPARLFGTRPLRFGDLPRDPARRPRLKIANPLSGSRVRFVDTSTATITPPAPQE